MPVCYKVEQLLLLRTSPLVCKPENFPPLEEWMGYREPAAIPLTPADRVVSPPQEQKQKGVAPPRGRLDDHAILNEPSQRRPSLLDTHHITKKSSTGEIGSTEQSLPFSLLFPKAPEDIILGPPKTAFASANSRNALKSPSLDTTEEPAASKNRFSFQERIQKDRGLVDSEKKEGRYNGMNNRRLGRDEREDWQNGRRRHHDQEEGDGRPRRNGDKDRSRWDREPREQDIKADGKRLSRDGARRDGRGKFDQPWFRGDKTQDGGDDAMKAPTRQNEWRKDRGSGRGPECDRPQTTEQDPEWMDSTGPNESRQAHTQEEFQRWKESMKATTEGNDRLPEKQETVQQPEIKKVEPPPMPAFLEPSEVESGMEKYFAFYGDRKRSSEQKPAEAKAQRKPRFAALFSPETEEAPKISPFVEPTAIAQDSGVASSQAPTAPADANKDKEHFDRVLQMLAGRSSNNTPQSNTASKSPKDLPKREELEKPRDILKSPLSEVLLQKRDQAHVQENRLRDQSSATIDDMLGPRAVEQQQQQQTQPQRTPREPTPNRDAELLLRLMRQSGIAQDSTPSQHSGPEASRSAAEPRPFPGGVSRQPPADQSSSDPRTFFEDPAILQMQRHEQAAQSDSQQRRTMNGPPSAFFDEPFFNNLRQATQQPMGNLESTAQSRAANFLPGMQRPPGFDRMTAPPPPAWQAQPQRPPPLQAQQHNGMNAPPSIPNPATARAMNVGPYAPTNPALASSAHLMQPPPHHQQQVPAPPQQRQRKYTGDNGSAYPPLGIGGPGPGPTPPAGFMNAHAHAPPPLGFLQHMPLARGGGGPAQQFPDGGGNGGMLPRHLMEMLASGQGQRGGDGRDGGGGGGGMPGHYR